MKLLDRIAFERAISIILNFILSIIKIFVPSSMKDDTKSPIRKRWRLRKDSDV